MNIMLDMETLGTRPGSVILTLALVPFYVPAGESSLPLYIKIDPESCKAYGLTTDAHTIKWWERQDPAVKQEAFSGKIDLPYALATVTEYLQQQGDSIYLWGNGSDFDNVLLQAAYEKCGMTVPWSHYNNRCYRTLKNIAKSVPSVPIAVGKHNALVDAKHQAAHAESIFEFLGFER